MVSFIKKLNPILISPKLIKASFSKLIFDLSLAKKLGKNWNCTLSYNDIFKNTRYSERFTINNISSRARYLLDANELSLTLRYSFGKIKDSEFKEKSVNDNESRIR